MKRILAVKDEDTLFEVANGDQVIKENSIEILILWDEVRGGTIKERYEALRQALSLRWGMEVSAGTAYVVFEEAVRTVNDLKKTHSVVAS